MATVSRTDTENLKDDLATKAEQITQAGGEAFDGLTVFQGGENALLEDSNDRAVKSVARLEETFVESFCELGVDLDLLRLRVLADVKSTERTFAGLDVETVRLGFGNHIDDLLVGVVLAKREDEFAVFLGQRVKHGVRFHNGFGFRSQRRRCRPAST